MSFDLALKDCDKYDHSLAFKKGIRVNEPLGCFRCIELEPTFVKAYLRKAKVHAGIGQSSKAMAAYEKALELDPNCAEAVEGYKACAIQVITPIGSGKPQSMFNQTIFQSHSDPEETRRRAMNDPEVQKILADPAMRMILEQMQSDPQAINEHLKNPAIAEKFLKLRESGLIQVAYK
jgi:stress-induced-phosphoprotein 1